MVKKVKITIDVLEFYTVKQYMRIISYGKKLNPHIKQTQSFIVIDKNTLFDGEHLSKTLGKFYEREFLGKNGVVKYTRKNPNTIVVYGYISSRFKLTKIDFITVNGKRVTKNDVI